MTTTKTEIQNLSFKHKSLFSRLRQEWVGLLILLLLAGFPFLFAWLSGTSVIEGPSRFWQGLMITFFIMAVYAMSYDLLIGYTGILSFGHAAFFGGGAYTMALWLTHAVPQISSRYRISLPGGADITEAVLFAAGILLVGLVVTLLGLLFSAASARVRGVYFAMISLAMAESLHILSKATDFVRWTGADEGLHGIPVPAWINPTQNRLLFYFVALGFALAMYLLMRRIVDSPTGRVFVAIRENESRVRMIGYNPVVFRSIAFITSAVIAGLAGALFSLWNMSATPTMTGAVMTINALIMTILGGIGTLIGPILGAGLMQIVGQFFYQWFGPRWPLVFGLIFIALVLFLPYGVIGTWRQKRYVWKQAIQNLFRKK
ncbi:MAG: branched-chain amino acid ABC transporter permease [Chloroflexota bacterium]